MLCFVLLVHYITLLSACQVFFSFFQYFFILPPLRAIQFFVRHFCLWKNHQKSMPLWGEIFSWYVFYKKNCPFSSQLNIYKSNQMRYNIFAVGNRRQVPFVAHCKARFCGMSISWHHHAGRHDRCAILLQSLRQRKSVASFFFAQYIN